MQAVAPLAQAGDAVDVVVEAPRQPDGIESAPSRNPPAARRTDQIPADGLEGFDEEIPVGEAVTCQLGMTVHGGHIAPAPAHHQGLEAVGRIPSDIVAHVRELAVGVKPQCAALQKSERAVADRRAQPLVHGHAPGKRRQLAEKFPVPAPGRGGDAVSGRSSCRHIVVFRAKIAQTKRPRNRIYT